jgi:ADP-ribose pyrophosphatase
VNDLEGYLDFAARNPEMFINPDGAVFTILLDREAIHQVEDEMEARLKEQGVSGEDAHIWSRVGFVFQDQYLRIARDAVRFPDGSLGTYIRILDDGNPTPGVIILPIYEGKVVLVNHFRHATRRWHLEIPRGFGHPNATPEESARAELAEEIGGDPVEMISLGAFEPDAGASIERDELFFAELRSYGMPDEHEAINEIRLVPVAEFEAMLRDGIITDGFTLAAYARAKLRSLL